MELQTSLVLDTAERILKDLADAQTIILSGGNAWKQPLWDALDDIGLPCALAPEVNGGHGLSLAEGFSVFRAAGRAGLAVPLADIMMSNWILGHTGLRIQQGSKNILASCLSADIGGGSHGIVTMRARKVPFGREATHFVLVADFEDGIRVGLVPASQCQVSHGSNLAGDPSDDVRMTADINQLVEPEGLTSESIYLLGAVTRSLQIAGALETLLGASVAHSQERVAFGRPIAKFQAVQHNLARLGGEVAAAVAVAESAANAFTTLPFDSQELLLEVASAKIRCGEAAEIGTLIAHQVHGAIGYTDEHILHRHSLRALAWRDDFGNERTWAKRLGEVICNQSSSQLWQLLASR